MELDIDAHEMSPSTRTQPPSAFLMPRPVALPVILRGAGAVVIVILFGVLVARSAGLTAIDLSISKSHNAFHTGALGGVTSAIYTIFSPTPAILITIVAAAVVWLVTRSWRHAVTFGAVVAVTWLPSAVVKAIVHRPRPDVALLTHPFSHQPTDPSYPSGHVVFVTAFVMAVFLLTRGRRSHAIVGVLGGLLVASVAVALVIDGVHYSSDVLASIAWSLGLAPLVLELWNRLIIPGTFRTKRTEEVSA